MNHSASNMLAGVALTLITACGQQQVSQPETTADAQTVSTEDQVAATEKPVENPSADDAGVDGSADSAEEATQPTDDDETEVALDAEDLDNAEVIPPESSNLFASADQRIFADELQARTEQRKAERDRLAAEAQVAPAGAPASQSQPAAAEKTTSANPPATTPTVPAAGLSPVAPAAPSTSAVDEKAILKEKDGQWAASAEASSTYGESVGNGRYSASQATGAPNVPQYSDHPNSWATRNGDAALPEWLHLSFAKPVHARSIRIRQSTAPGAVAKIELIDSDGGLHVIWEGIDATVYPKNTIGWLIRDFDSTGYLVAGARITLVTNRVWGWNEIDAVQLVGTK